MNIKFFIYYCILKKYWDTLFNIQLCKIYIYKIRYIVYMYI